MSHRSALLKIYHRLFECYGPQNWWPADSPFEVMVGAILTQNTSWSNAEKALNNLKKSDALNIHSILKLTEKELAKLIKPSGYFNIKSKRLKNYVTWFEKEGRFNCLNKLDDNILRERLLNVNGIGPETADDILLYAFERPVFVIDAYTRRLLKSMKMIDGAESYEKLRFFFESSLSADIGLFKEYHALIVRHAKEKCTHLKNCRHCIVETPM
ncbi:MAG: endonuclease [Legionellales bacterium]|nr:endonuclease [Legionellales bacterium]|tara:strand:- start:166 stop:804 length:639 start_codon:yes stop_codon:yes gene_type:complete